jgi:hypothetical protein
MKPEEVLELTIKLPGLTDYSKQPCDGDVNEMLVNVFNCGGNSSQRWLAYI